MPSPPASRYPSQRERIGTRKVRVLASGSSGNATFVRLGETRILVDAGVSLSALESALDEIDESVDGLSAVLITHEHGDHVSGLGRLLKARPELPVLATSGTLRAMKLTGADTRRIRAGKIRPWAGVDIIPFTVSHDAAEPVGVRFEAGDFALAIATDLGFWSDEVADALHGCPFIVVEANHDPEMLFRGPYPPFLKRRVSSRRGHLSNGQARSLLDRIVDPALECVVLAHLSETNNTSELAHRSVADVLQGSNVRVVVARPRAASEVFEPTGRAVFEGPPRQLSLF